MKIAFITDIHEDIISLKNAFRIIDKLSVNEVVCLGDISGFSAPNYKYLRTRNAHECLRLIRENCKYVIIGNHDIHAAQIIPKNCNFFNFPENWYQLDYHDRYSLAGDKLWMHEEYDLNPLYKLEDIEYLKSLPEYIICNMGGVNILLTHYIYPNILGLKREFYTYADEFRKHFVFMKEKGCVLSFTGHSHVNGFFISTGKSLKYYKYTSKVLNQNSFCFGLPPITCNNKRSGFSIFDTEEYKIKAVRF
ncbi:MAG: metallophosphoesterase [Bacteroidales bacterium]|nr:metallophosphoesterase [Bacteroidales bacterium]MBN2819728.1 metallophosphoesterase [Bacteroidales bacterium]